VIDPLLVSFTVSCSPAHAFEVWTSKMSMWWPTSHTLSQDRDLNVIIEPCVGGRIFERTSRGAEHDWGEVTYWEPPNRFGYLWHLRTTRQEATEVDIRFVDCGNEQTEIRIEQRGFDRLGESGQERRDKNTVGWSVVIPLFLACVG
jgi:hypothetical protein